MIKERLERLRDAGFTFKSFRFRAPLSVVPDGVAGTQLPRELKRLFRNQSACVNARYYYEARGETARKLKNLIGDSTISGGPVLWSPRQMLAGISELCSWAENTWGRDDQKEAAIWKSAIPFCPMINGDYLGLSRKGQVLYLCHDNRSFVLSESFGEFWKTWERLYFLGPEWWMLRKFSTHAGRLNPESANIRRLQTLVQKITASSMKGR